MCLVSPLIVLISVFACGAGHAGGGAATGADAGEGESGQAARGIVYDVLHLPLPWSGQ
jgi:hypothetical protein